jgi:two-component system, sensor histidine kinase PdtaS
MPLGQAVATPISCVRGRTQERLPRVDRAPARAQLPTDEWPARPGRASGRCCRRDDGQRAPFRCLGSTQVPFDGHLRDLCDDLAARFGRSDGPRLTCVVANEALPIGALTILALIAEVLVTDALIHGFPPGRGGRIAVSFTAGQEAWQLTVDDSGIAVRSHGDPRDHNLTIARQRVLQLGGRLELSRVTGGTRCIVTLPRPER